MSSKTPDDRDVDDDRDRPTATGTDAAASDIRSTFEVCDDCGAIGAPGTGHRCYVAGGITALDETTSKERDWRREADERSPSTTVYTVPSTSRVAVYHERGGCHRADADEVEATALGVAKRRDRVPCANPECRRARDDRVYGELYDPLDDDQ